MQQHVECDYYTAINLLCCFMSLAINLTMVGNKKNLLAIRKIGRENDHISNNLYFCLQILQN